jgi:hypothetical protein
MQKAKSINYILTCSWELFSEIIMDGTHDDCVGSDSESIFNDLADINLSFLDHYDLLYFLLLDNLLLLLLFVVLLLSSFSESWVIREGVFIHS